MLATLDGITDDGRGLEIKTFRHSAQWGEEGTDEVPVPYIIQCQHNMVVAGLEVFDVPVLIGGSDFRIYEVPADPELQAMMIEREAAFWQMVEAKTPPEPITFADAIKRFATSEDVSVRATPEVLEAVEILRLQKVIRKEADKEEEAARFTILDLIREADTLVDAEDNVLLTYKQSKDSQRFDVKAFRGQHEVLYDYFCVTKPGSRRLLLKGGK